MQVSGLRSSQLNPFFAKKCAHLHIYYVMFSQRYQFILACSDSLLLYFHIWDCLTVRQLVIIQITFYWNPFLPRTYSLKTLRKVGCSSFTCLQQYRHYRLQIGDYFLAISILTLFAAYFPQKCIFMLFNTQYSSWSSEIFFYFFLFVFLLVYIITFKYLKYI